MGCGGSKQEPVKEETEIYIEGISVPDTEPGYPPPKPPRNRKDQVFNATKCGSLDEHAKQAPRSLNNNYSTLIQYLVEPAQNDVEKARAIFVWLASQHIYDFTYPNVKDAYSPDGYMKTIQQGNGFYHYFYALLCRAAGLPCVVIRGCGKSASYEVGDQDISSLNSTWNAVHLDGSWRIVHPRWAMTGVVGFDLGNWTKVEESGQATRQVQTASKGKMVYSMDEFWFLTDPDEFIYFCLATEPEWQLLKKSWNMYRFTNVPYFTDQYFGSGLTLTSDHKAILKSLDGQCEISFDHSESQRAKLDYTLFFDEKNSEDKLPAELQLEQYVIHSVGQTIKSLVIRFPVVGFYKIEISAIQGSRRFQICSFRLDCDASLKHVMPFPINPAIGFGYTDKAEDAGLMKPSQVKGIMVVRRSDKVIFQFRKREKVEVQAVLVHKDQPSSELASYVRQDESNNNVTIAVTVPEHAQNPEYALQVNIRQEGSQEPYENVVNYLLTHGNKEVENKKKGGIKNEKDLVTQDDKRKKLVEATQGEDIDSLEKAIRDFERSGLEDLDDLTHARERLVRLHEEALKKAIMKRNLKHLEEVINRAEKSRVFYILSQTDTMKDALALASLLRRLKRYTHRVLELKPSTVSEIHSYKRPLPIIHTVMKATYLLLGEKEKQLQVWEYIQSLLRRQGRDRILRRIQEFDIIHTKQSTFRRAEVHLNACSEEDIRLTSAGASTFFIWSRNITKEVKQGNHADEKLV